MTRRHPPPLQFPAQHGSPGTARVLLPGLALLLLVGFADHYAPWTLAVATGLAVTAAVARRWRRWRRERCEDVADLAEGRAFAAHDRFSAVPIDPTAAPPTAGQSVRPAGRAS
ncbi:hypothetical protein [Pseudonocardia sp.]|uniref:hypothetical protein n=1 Tax=Pseudonocardia sp. TaxID=60912 RepID=UPI003D136F24